MKYSILTTLSKLKTPIIIEKAFFNYEIGWSSIEVVIYELKRLA
jgi:hypothetical protein